MSDNNFIPYHLPSIGEDEVQAVAETLRSGWLTTGKRTAQFESEFAGYVHAPHALAVNSCTAGLHLALVALGIGPGDEVITTPMTFCSTVTTILHTGATAVLADVGPDGNLDPDSVIARITPKTKAILPVHLAGLPCQMDRIWKIAREHNLKVIEDAAHAAGSFYRGSPIGGGWPAEGAYSDAVAFSFYATKNLTTGEGGMVTTHNRDVYDRMRLLCLHGISKDAWNRYSKEGSWYYQVVDLGFKYNLSDIQSAIGIQQLRKLESFIAVRTRYAEMYNEAFRDVAEVEVPATDPHSRHCWHLYTLRLNLDRLAIDRAAFMEELRKLGIGASVHFIPVTLHPAFSSLSGDSRNDCPKSLALYPRLVSLPLYPAMTLEQVRRTTDAVKSLVLRHSRMRAA